jgi:hypothetical protein
MIGGLLIDSLTIHSHKFLNSDVTNPSSSIEPFTYNFWGPSSMTMSDFVVALVNMLYRMKADGLRVAGITSDGCSFQIAGLSSRAPLSIQATYPEPSKFIVVPCVCHGLQNSIKRPSHKNPLDGKMISAARLVSVDIRELRCRDVVHAAGPTHYPAGWIHDYPLLKLLLDHEEIAFDLIRYNNGNSDKPIYSPHKIFARLPL